MANLGVEIPPAFLLEEDTRLTEQTPKLQHFAHGLRVRKGHSRRRVSLCPLGLGANWCEKHETATMPLGRRQILEFTASRANPTPRSTQNLQRPGLCGFAALAGHVEASISHEEGMLEESSS